LKSCLSICSSVRDKLGNGATYSGELFYADPCGACEVHGLGLMSIGVTVGNKIILLKQRF